jgi:hypothetical protein
LPRIGEADDQRANLRATDLEIVDPDGTIRFGRSVVRTWDAGLVPGDVYRPYFVPYVPGGGIEPWFLSWSTLVGAVSIAGSLLALAANVDGVLGLLERVRRLTRGSAALSDIAVELEARKARSDVFYELLGRRPWAPADLAERLDTTVDNAIALLEVFGFEHAESGLWHRGTSSDAEFLRQLLDEIIVAGGHPAGSTGGGFEERVGISLRTEPELRCPTGWGVRHADSGMTITNSSCRTRVLGPARRFRLTRAGERELARLRGEDPDEDSDDEDDQDD